jgi:hypothetical protein
MKLSNIFNQVLINEEKLGMFYNKNGNNIEIYRNPNSIKRFQPNCRAICLPNGDLIVADDQYNVIHGNLSEWIRNHNIFNTPKKFDVYKDDNMDTFILLMRYCITNTFYLSESYLFDEFIYNTHAIYKTLLLAVQKNPNTSFVIKNITQANEEKDFSDDNNFFIHK